ncbi:protein of unknown function [Burkholderia multivorans]
MSGQGGRASVPAAPPPRSTARLPAPCIPDEAGPGGRVRERTSEPSAESGGLIDDGQQG